MDYTKEMWLLLLLFSLMISAQDQAVEKYCAITPHESQLLMRDLTPLILPSEEMVKQDNCLILKLKPHRRSFFEAYVLKKFPNTHISFSSAEIKRETCFLKVEKIKRKKADVIEVSSSDLRASSESSQEVQKETINIQTVNDFELIADQTQIKGNCRYITKNLYEIKITVHQNPKPLSPPNLPQGTIVIINNPPPKQETTSLSTEIQLNRGQIIELGSFIKKIKNDHHDISIKPNLEIDQLESMSEEQVFLSLE